MKHSKKSITFVVMSCLAGLCATGFAQAEDSHNIYAGANYGYLSVDNDDFDDDDDAYTAYLGGNFTDFLGAEVSYVDFGNRGNDLANVDINGYTAALVGYLPIAESVKLYGKAGMLFWDSELDTALGNFDSDGEEVMFAVGTEFEINEALDLRVEYTRFKVEVESDEAGGVFTDEDFNLNYVSLGLQLSF